MLLKENKNSTFQGSACKYSLRKKILCDLRKKWDSDFYVISVI